MPSVTRSQPETSHAELNGANANCVTVTENGAKANGNGTPHEFAGNKFMTSSWTSKVPVNDQVFGEKTLECSEGKLDIVTFVSECDLVSYLNTCATKITRSTGTLLQNCCRRTRSCVQ